MYVLHCVPVGSQDKDDDIWDYFDTYDGAWEAGHACQGEAEFDHADVLDEEGNVLDTFDGKDYWDNICNRLFGNKEE